MAIPNINAAMEIFTEQARQKLERQRQQKEAQLAVAPNLPEDTQTRAAVEETAALLHPPEDDTGERKEDAGQELVHLSPSLLDRYHNDPFREYSGERLDQLVGSIREYGVLSPIVVRPKEGGRYEILSGRNRNNAAKENGLAEVPCIVKDVDDDQAALIVTESNLNQRENLLPSEKAFAYKMQNEALKKQGKKSLFLPEISDNNRDNQDLCPQDTNDNTRRTIHRYIRLTYLLKELLEQVDGGALALAAAEHISYLSEEEQSEAHEYFFVDNRGMLDIKTAKRLREAAEKKVLTYTVIEKLLTRQKPKPSAKPSLQIRMEKIKPYVPEGMKKAELEQYILAALDFFRQHGHDGREETT